MENSVRISLLPTRNSERISPKKKREDGSFEELELIKFMLVRNFKTFYLPNSKK